jgi:hypothetical protein
MQEGMHDMNDRSSAISAMLSELDALTTDIGLGCPHLIDDETRALASRVLALAVQRVTEPVDIDAWAEKLAADGAGQVAVVFSSMLRDARNGREWLMLARSIWPDATSYKVPPEFVSRREPPEGGPIDEEVDDVLAAKEIFEPA